MYIWHPSKAIAGIHHYYCFVTKFDSYVFKNEIWIVLQYTFSFF